MKHLLLTLSILFSVSLWGQEECVVFEDTSTQELLISTNSLDPNCTVFRTAIHVIHSEFNGVVNADIPDEQAESAIRSLNAFFTNSGHKEYDENIPLNYTFQLDTVTQHSAYRCHCSTEGYPYARKFVYGALRSLIYDVDREQ